MLPTTRRILFFRRLFGGMSAKKNVFSSSSDGVKSMRNNYLIISVALPRLHQPR